MNKFKIASFIVCVIGTILGVVALGWSLLKIDWIIHTYGIAIAFWQIVSILIPTVITGYLAFDTEEDS